MNFFLKEPKSKKETLIYLIYSKAAFKYSTGKKILPSLWNYESNMPLVKRGRSASALKRLSVSLMEYQEHLDLITEEYRYKEDNLTKDILKKSFDLKFNPRRIKQEKQIYFVDFIDDFVKIAPNRINRSTKRKYSESKIKHYKKAANKLREYENFTKSKIKITEFSLDTYDSFVNWCLDKKKYSINYTGDLIKLFKTLLNISKELGYIPHSDLENNKLQVLKEESISIALNEVEIENIFKLDLSKDLKLQNVRDFAIIGFWTGLRISDLLSLPEIDITKKFIVVQPKKTKNSSGEKVVIPLHHHILSILQQRGMPKPMLEKDFNLDIKRVCKRAGITNIVKGSLMNPETKRKEVGQYPKYKLVSSHTCRRSFATNLYKMNFPTLSIMKITGHSTEKSFLTYIKVTPQEHAKKLLDHWNDYYDKNIRD